MQSTSASPLKPHPVQEAYQGLLEAAGELTKALREVRQELQAKKGDKREKELLDWVEGRLAQAASALWIYQTYLTAREELEAKKEEWQALLSRP